MRVCIPRLLALTLGLSLLWAGPSAFGQDQNAEVLLDPALRSLVEAEPETPAETLQVIRSLTQLGRPDLAKPFLQELAAAEIPPQTALELREDFGTATLLQLQSKEELQPEGAQIAGKVIQGSQALLSDPAYINSLLDRMISDDPTVRRYYQRKLQATGTAMLNPTLQRLADDARAEEHRYYREALVFQGKRTVPGLVAALDSENAGLKASVIRVLGRLDDLPSAYHLLYPAVAEGQPQAVQEAASRSLQQLLQGTPSPRIAVQMLLRRANEYYELNVPFERSLEGQIEAWNWQSEDELLNSEIIPVEQLSLRWAAELANDAYRLAPENPRVKQLALKTAFEQAALGDASPEEPPEATVEELSALIESVLRTRHTIAATVAMQLLAEQGDASVLVPEDGSMSVVVKAADDPDARLRLAAVETVGKWNPEEAFPGASVITRAIGGFIFSNGVPQAIVVTADNTHGRQLAGLLVELGYDVEIARDGDDLFRLAARLADTELVLIGVRINKPRAEFARAQLRHDARTAYLPVGFVAQTNTLEEARRLARRDPLAASVLLPTQPQALASQLAPLMNRRQPHQIVTPEESLQQAQRALDVLLKLSETDRGIFDWSRLEDMLLEMVYTPAVRGKVFEILANLPSAAGQQRLLEVASSRTQSMETRQAALAAFEASVDRIDLQLTTTQIMKQYNLYNASEEALQAEQQLLGKILDIIEGRTEEQPAEEANR